jgi:hypothetical protein
LLPSCSASTRQSRLPATLCWETSTKNLAIADIVKDALNKGIRPEIYFFRDSHGKEINLLVRGKGMPTPVEIKSAATFSTDFVKQLEWFQTLGLKRVRLGAVRLHLIRWPCFRQAGNQDKCMGVNRRGHA